MQSIKSKVGISVLLAAFLFSTVSITPRAATPVTSARSAVLYEPQTQSFLIEKNAHERLPMASTTKIMTALIAIEESDLSDTVVIDKRASGIEGSSAYLSVGDEYTMEEMLYALLLQSANDAAIAIAYTVAGTVENFVDLMNQRSKQLGLEDTHFDNPNGLDSEYHFTTAHDLALIASTAMKNNTFCEIVATVKKSIGADSSARYFVNHNKLLRLYEGCSGIKTGFTKKSGRCLVGSAEKSGLQFITVTLDAPNDWNDHISMLDYGYSKLECKTLASQGEYSYNVPHVSSREAIRVENKNELRVILPKSSDEITKEIELRRFLSGTVNKDDVVGRVIFKHDGITLGSVDLVATESYKVSERKTVLDHLIHFLKKDI